MAFYFAASGAVNVAAKLVNARSRENSAAESKYDALKPVELGDREYLAKRTRPSSHSQGLPGTHS